MLLRPYIAPGLHNYVDNCLKNTNYSFLQKQRHVGNMLLLCFVVRVSFYVTYIRPLISSLTCLQIIKLYVLIQEWEDKTEVLQSSLYRLNSGENISKLVNAIRSSLILLPWSFSQSLLYISVCQPMIKIAVNRYAILYQSFLNSIFKFFFQNRSVAEFSLQTEFWWEHQ